jgi:hypothetical protein
MWFRNILDTKQKISKRKWCGSGKGYVINERTKNPFWTIEEFLVRVGEVYKQYTKLQTSKYRKLTGTVL